LINKYKGTAFCKGLKIFNHISRISKNKEVFIFKETANSEQYPSDPYDTHLQNPVHPLFINFHKQITFKSLRVGIIKAYVQYLHLMRNYFLILHSRQFALRLFLYPSVYIRQTCSFSKSQDEPIPFKMLKTLFECLIIFVKLTLVILFPVNRNHI
jgi:hypothetical protein